MELGNMAFGHSRGEYPIPDRESWQDLFCEYLEKMNINFYGYFNLHNDERLEPFETDRGGFENDVFLINPYYWGDDEQIAEEPNFLFKPTGFCIDWYKYPLRDSYMNQDITFEEFKEILEACYKSYLDTVPKETVLNEQRERLQKKYGNFREVYDEFVGQYEDFVKEYEDFQKRYYEFLKEYEDFKKEMEK